MNWKHLASSLDRFLDLYELSIRCKTSLDVFEREKQKMKEEKENEG